MTFTARGRSRVSAGNGAVTAFSVPFQYQAGGLFVYLLAADSDPEAAAMGPDDGTLLTEGAHYSVAGDGAAGAAVVTTVATYATGQYLLRWRSTSLDQVAQYVPGAFPAAPTQLTLDRAAMALEEVADDRARLAARTVQVPVGQSAPALDLTLFEGKAITANAGGTAFVPMTLDGDGGVSALDSLADPEAGGALVAFTPAGANAETRDVQAKLREVSVSVADYGGVSSASADNTAAFNAAIAALGADGGIVDIPDGTWRINLIVDHANITLRGRGGVGDDESRPCLRPYNTGAGTATVKIGNQTGYRFRNKLENLVISGDRGDGTMADKALWLAGGCIFFSAQDLDLRDGLHSLHVEPGGTYAVTGLKLDRLFIRNDVNNAAARAVYVRKYADATGYVTDFHLNMSKVNKTGAGYWLEVDGTGSTGLVVHFGATYVDHGAGMGILCSASGLETIECFNGLQLDPGAAGTVIMKRRDLVKDPTRYMRGFIEGVGGQKIEFSDSSQITFPAEPGVITYEPRLQNAFLGSITYFSPDPNDPYNLTINVDFASAVGPQRWNGTQHRWTDTTDATSASTGAMGTSGGISAAKTIWAGAKVVATTGFFYGATKVVGARGSALPADATDLATAITLLNALKAGVSAAGGGSTHGLFP